MSDFLSLNLKDLAKGLFMAVLGAVLMTIQQVIADGGSVTAIDWSLVGNVAISAAIIYLVKNLLTTPDGKVLGVIG